MRIFITGGTGFIGSHLIPHLLPAHTITVLTRNTERAENILRKQVQYISDIAEIDKFGPPDAIINLAGEPIADKRWTTKQKHHIAQSRWHITQKIVEYIDNSHCPPNCFISGSAIGYYGAQGDNKLTERSIVHSNEFAHELCKKWEETALSARCSRTSVIRTGIVLAKNFGAVRKMELPFLLGLGGKIGSGRQFMSWIHIEDMIHAILWLLNQNNASGIYNLTAPTPVTNSHFSHSLAKQLKRPCFATMPLPIIKLLMGESSELVTQGQNVVPEKLLNQGFKFKYSHLETALSNLYH